MEGQSAARLTGAQKAAILLAVVGEEAATVILRNLPERDAQRIAEELIDLRNVAPELANAVLAECYKAAIGDEFGLGGSEYAKQLLLRAYGEDAGRTLLRRAARLREAPGNFDWLAKSDPELLVRFIDQEHPQTIALVLAHLEPKQGCGVLLKLPEQLRADAVKRLANLKQFSPQVAQKVSTVLQQKLKAMGEQSHQSYAGLKGVADLMNRMHAPTATAILETIERDEPNLAVNIRRLMFTFEDLISVPETSLRDWLAALDKKVLATALRGASEEVKNHIFRAMSSRAVEMLKEDMDALGPVRSREVTKAQEEAIAIARRLEAEGKLILKDEGEGNDEYVV
jgi:flagellar motor switch protein FliG